MRKQFPAAAGPKPDTEPTAQDDDIYPLHVYDEARSRRIFVTRVFRFNDVLDASILRDSLAKLLEMGDWRKLGGQLHYNSSGGVEVHVPKCYTDKRPAFTFTHDEFLNKSIAKHPSASSIHAPTESASIQDMAAARPSFVARPDFPTTVKEMARRGMPQLLLHVTSFSDATLVSLVWPHTMADAFSILDLLKNWSLVLADREGEVSPVLGTHEDVILQAEEAEPEQNREPLLLESLRLSGVPMVRWGLRYLWRHVSNPALESKTLFMPKDVLERLIIQMQKEIAAMPVEEGQSKFASENDMLTAWAAQIVASSEPAPRPITVMAFFNLRARLSQFFGTGGVYMQNMLMLTCAFLSAPLLRGPTGAIAVAHRRHVQEQTTVPQVLSFMRALRGDLVNKGRERLLFGQTESIPIIVNSFFKADFHKAADFGPAVVRAGAAVADRSNPPGSMIMYYYRVYSRQLDMVASFYMLGKDHAGNGWFQGNLLPRAWAEMQKRLDELQR